VILVRRGGYAVGVFDGRQLRSSKVGRTYVQGRTKAGGWSQQRYARRRTQQADNAYAAAADTAAQVLLPVVNELEAVVGGGDRSGVDSVLADPRLRPLRALLTGRVLATPDPRLDVLRRFGDQLRAVEISLNELA
jgi:peptide subunit release factor 1 (eRF1)